MGIQRTRPSHEILSGDSADVYFARAERILEAEGRDPMVTMEVFTRREAVLCGIDEAKNLLGHVLAGADPTNATLEALDVIDPESMAPVPRDGAAIGEIMIRGNTVMKGYLADPAATQAAFAGGWYHTGDLAVMHPDGYAEVKDRSKDIIISGGENISSIEVEAALYRHPAVLEAAVVAKPDPKWGESPCAFVTLKDGAAATPEDLIAHCRTLLAGFKTPKTVIFGPLPKTSTGKIQKHELRDQVKG